MFLTTVRVRQARSATCADHGVPYAPHLVEVMVNGKPRAIVTVEASSGRVATVEWRESDYPPGAITKVVQASVPLMQAAERQAA